MNELIDWLKQQGQPSRDVIEAFAAPDKFDWAAKANQYEAVVLECVEYGHAQYTWGSLMDRDKINAAANGLKYDSIRVSRWHGGWFLELVTEHETLSHRLGRQ